MTQTHAELYGSVQEWLADCGPAPSRDSEGIWEAWRNGDELPIPRRRPVSFELADDVEIPDYRAGDTKYPWPEMEPGQSFFVRDEDGPDNMSSVGNSGRKWCERHRPGCTIIQRRMRGGTRFWMVEVDDGE